MPANVANLLLSRAAARQREVAIRAALGAGWNRLLRQLMTESVLLALIGGAAGPLIAELSLYLVRRLNLGNIPRLDAIEIDGGVLAFTLGVSLLTGMAFGLAPGLCARRVDLTRGFRTSGRTGGGFHCSRLSLRSLLVVTEFAFLVMLLIGAGLLLRSFVRLQRVLPGFNPEQVISMRVGASKRFQELEPRIASLPGVKSL